MVISRDVKSGRREVRSARRRVLRLDSPGGSSSGRRATNRSNLDRVTVEEPLEIRIAGRSFVVTMRTPGDDENLAAGLLATEGLVNFPSEIVRIAPCRDVDEEAEGNVLDVHLSGDAPFRWARVKRRLISSSSCGVCGKESIDQVRRHCDPVTADLTTVPFETLVGFPEKLRLRQSTFEKTGGIHAAGLFNRRGRLLGIAEDVGRHNAVDKLLGSFFRAGRWPLRGRILLVSGRSSFEIVQKALAAGVPIVAAVSAPSSLAVDLAVEAGMTLVGFLREGRANVYSGTGRIERREGQVDVAGRRTRRRASAKRPMKST